MAQNLPGRKSRPAATSVSGRPDLPQPERSATIVGSMTGTTHRRRSRRDWVVDTLIFIVALLGSVFLYDAGDHDPISSGLLALDFVSGILLCFTLWFRRRWPVQLALL